MNPTYDAIIIGMGIMGSAAAYHLTKRGQHVLGIDQFNPPHTLGSSHGHTRITRQAYLEGASYVPMAQRSHELWRELEKETGKTLLAEIGGLNIGPENCQIVKGTVESADCYSLPYEILNAHEVQKRFPAFQLDTEEVGVYETIAGAVFPEESIRAHIDIASRHGLNIRTNERVIEWSVKNDRVTIHTERGCYQAETLILSAGAWSPQLFGFDIPLEVERKVPVWFQPDQPSDLFKPGDFPSFVWHCTDESNIYGLPGFHGEGVKVGFHQGGLKGEADQLSRQASWNETEDVRRTVASRFPRLNTQNITYETCLYTNTPDGHFVLGYHPKYQNVVTAGGFSGHGFKFGSVVGEILADLAMKGHTNYDIALFNPNRFSIDGT